MPEPPPATTLLGPGGAIRPEALPGELWHRIREYDRAVYAGVHPAGWNERDTYLDYIGENRIAAEGIAQVLRYVPDQPRQTPVRLLDVGCGLGGTLRAAAASGRCRLWGLEPDPPTLELCRELLQALGIQATLVTGAGEALPFPDGSFDAVTNLTILEHVRDPTLVLREAMRVLRPGGVLYCFAPNYRFPWEGHYRMLWLPLFPRVLARGYLRLRGRDPRFFDRLHYITPDLVLRTLQRCRPTRLLDLSGARFREKLEQPGSVTTAASRRLLAALRGLPGLGAALPGLAGLAHRLGFAYPLVVVAIK
jgi:SAM-dependent methyltransferase